MAKRRALIEPQAIDNMSDEKLLATRVRDFGLRIEGTVLEGRIARLHEELAARGLDFRPSCYLADEWLTPDGVPIIGIPFFLAHPRLAGLERKMMLEVEGGTESWCMKLLRHEAGHAINYAFRLYSRTRWRELFGPFTMTYRTSYNARPYSKRFVVHLEDNYAQAHPDEDFAETFAVWLTPGSRWEDRYRGWPALKKLKYVDHLMDNIAGTKPLVTSGETPWSAARMRSTLQAFYERRRKFLGDDFPGFYDPGLQRLFGASPTQADFPEAARFLRAHRRRIVNGVAAWTHQRKFDIDKLVRKLAIRCADMKLYLNKTELETAFEVVAFVTVVMSDTRKYYGGPGH